jgi:hypothetical protein
MAAPYLGAALGGAANWHMKRQEARMWNNWREGSRNDSRNKRVIDELQEIKRDIQGIADRSSQRAVDEAVSQRLVERVSSSEVTPGPEGIVAHVARIVGRDFMEERFGYTRKEKELINRRRKNMRSYYMGRSYS